MTTNIAAGRAVGARAAAVLLLLAPTARADDKPPITIGFSMEQTGGLAAVGKTGLLAFLYPNQFKTGDLIAPFAKARE